MGAAVYNKRTHVAGPIVTAPSVIVRKPDFSLGRGAKWGAQVRRVVSIRGPLSRPALPPWSALPDRLAHGLPAAWNGAHDPVMTWPMPGRLGDIPLGIPWACPMPL